MSFITQDKDAAFDHAATRTLEETKDTVIMQKDENFIVILLTDFNSGNYPVGYDAVSTSFVCEGTQSALKFRTVG